MENVFSGIDRRRFKRVLVNFLVVYRVKEPWVVQRMAGDRDLVAVMHDVSEGGVAIMTNHDLPPGSIVSIRFTLINHDAIGNNRVRTMEMAADIRYQIKLEKGEYRLGVRFGEIEQEDKTAIQDLTRILP